MRIIGKDHADHRPKGRARRLRTVAMLPTLLTVGNLLCGFAAIYFCILGVFDFATSGEPLADSVLTHRLFQKFLPTFMSVGGFLIFLGMVFDAMDGRVARITSGTTSFGGQLDSLADMVTFGIAPATLMIALVTIAARRDTEGMFVSTREAWMAGGILATCCALRLARFNVEHAEHASVHTSFRGLPSPGAGAVVASLIILFEHVPEVRSVDLINALPFVSIGAGLLMVSRIRYAHLGNMYLRGRQPFGYVIMTLIAIGLLIRFPAPTLTGIVCGYAASGPLLAIWRLVHPLPVEPAAAGAPADHPADGGQRLA